MPLYFSFPEMLDMYRPCGRLEVNEEKLTFGWRIPNFLSCTDDVAFRTRNFSFVGQQWYFKVYPNGNIQDNLHENGYVSIYLFRNSSGLPNKIDFRVTLQTIDGKTSMEHKEVTFTDGNCCIGFANYILRSQLIEKSGPSDTITIYCCLKKIYK